MNRLLEYWNQEKWFLIKIMVPLMLVFLFSQYVLFPIGQKINEYQAKFDELNQNTYSSEWLNGRKNFLQHNLNLLEILENLIQKNFANNDSLYSLDAYRKLAEETGMVVSSLRESSSPGNGYTEHNLQLVFSGDYFDFLYLLDQIDSITPAAYVTQFKLLNKSGVLQVSPFEITYYTRSKP